MTECAVRVLQATSDQLEFITAEIGQSAFDKHGSYLPDASLDLMTKCDSCLFGAVTSSEGTDYASPVLTFRKLLDLYANVRPVRTLVRTAQTMPIDVVIIRENSEGLYTQREEFDDEGVTTLRRVTRKASKRIVDFAIGYALANGRSKVTCVHKANVLRASDGLFLRTFRDRMAESAKTLAADEQLVDSAAMKLITSPKVFDVIVTLNLYGDILSDVAAGVAGGLGFAPSGNIGPRHSVFEPAHGSAPDIAGRGMANPTASILASAMMLKHLGMQAEARIIERAVSDVYASGHLTNDIGGRHGSKSFTDHAVENILNLGIR